MEARCSPGVHIEPRSICGRIDIINKYLPQSDSNLDPGGNSTGLNKSPLSHNQVVLEFKPLNQQLSPWIAVCKDKGYQTMMTYIDNTIAWTRPIETVACPSS